MEPTRTPPHINSHLIKIVDFFHEKLKFLDYFNEWLDDLSYDDKSLINAFQLLFKITEQRLQKSAISELNKEKKIHEVYHENENVKRTIKGMHNCKHKRNGNIFIH